MFADTLTILRYPTVVDHGAHIPDLAGTPTATVVPRCDAQPGAPQELLERRETARVAWTVYAPVDVDARKTDHARLNDDPAVYKVAGDPQRWHGTLAHAVLYLERWED